MSPFKSHVLWTLITKSATPSQEEELGGAPVVPTGHIAIPQGSPWVLLVTLTHVGQLPWPEEGRPLQEISPLPGSDLTVKIHRPHLTLALWLCQSSISGQHFESPAAGPFKANFPRPGVLKSLIIHPADKGGDLVNDDPDS